jgi:glucan phosphoethanolaminetransferase (alkaline phosphatase superfamily)
MPHLSFLFTRTLHGLPGFLGKLSGNIAIALLLTGLLLIPEFYLHWLGRLEGILWREDDIGYLFALFLFMRLIAAPGGAYVAVLLVIQALQLSEIGYFLFAGTFYGPAELTLLAREYKDFWGSLGDTTVLLIVPLAIVALSAAFILWVQRKTVHLSFRLGRRTGLALLGLWLCIPLIHAYTEDNSMRFDPDPGKTALRNGINAFAYYTVWDLLFSQTDANGKLYAPYQVSSLPPGSDRPPVNLVIIMGESITYTHMGLYGYERDTTPFLSSLKERENLVYRPAISSAVSTHVAIPMFYNIQYEPDNRTHIASGEANLYRLAKAKGMQTAFLSSQEMYAIASQVSHGQVDVWKELKHIEDLPGEFDARLLEALGNLDLDWEQPFLLSLNPRAGHIPYANHIPQEMLHFGKGVSKSDYHRYMRGTYDDAMRYFDQVVGRIIRFLERHTHDPTVVIITSDHGQRLGEKSGYGHNTLEFNSARVPFIYYGIHTPKAIDALAQRLDCLMNHYEMGQFIARLLGFRVVDPNVNPSNYYLNGIDLSGRGGSLQYSKADALEGHTCPQ